MVPPGGKGRAAPQPLNRELKPLNNNRGNNNRRRGRGNRQGGGGGGQQLNRIDSRARGNAPQLLEKYRKLAQDAHMNGDRVQAEYYLQFADHYFRVIADQRQRQEEQRRPRDERWQEGADGEREETDDAGDFSAESDFPSFDQPVYTRREREDRPRREEREDESPRSDDEGGEGRASGNPYEPAENPFVRGNREDRAPREERGTRGLRPRRDDRRPRRDERDSQGESGGLDPSLLPPAIGNRDEAPAADAGSDEAAKPRRKPVRRKPSADGADETLASAE